MINSVRNLVIRLRNDERGLTAIEYAVLGAIVVAAIGVAGATLSTDLNTAFGALIK